VFAALALAGGSIAFHVEADPTIGSTTTRTNPAGDPLASEPFNCGGSTGLGDSGAPAVALVSSVGVTEQSGFDRVTFEFRNGRPREVVIATQDTNRFNAGRGAPVAVLDGSRGATITLYGSDAHSDFKGPTDIHPRFSAVVELREIGAPAGGAEWAVGLAQAPCYRVAFYDNPVVLVADFKRA
jgi:hypothetical protein